MDNKLRETLIQNYSKEDLVDLILKLSNRYDGLNHSLHMLMGEKKEFLKQFYKSLSQFSDSKRFYAWNESDQLDSDLEEMLFNLEQGVEDPKDGLLGLKAFFEHDEYFVESSHDFTGIPFDITAVNLFIKYSHMIEDKNWVFGLVTDLLENDQYHVRACLSEKLHEFLPEEFLRKKINEFFIAPEKSKLEAFVLSDIARGLIDPVLFERANALSNHLDKDHINLEVGELWLNKGDPQTAIKYLENISTDKFREEKLLLEAYRLTDNKEKEKTLLWKFFKNEQTKESFDSLIKVEGEDKYQSILQEEIQKISKSLKLTGHHVTFLLAMGLCEEAENYIWERVAQLDGDNYCELARWAESFEENKRYLVATKIYRELIDSILKRAYSKSYHHGVDYLKKLEEFESYIFNWRPIESHCVYFEKIKKDHSRKSSFWSQYKEKSKI
jgi:hypothetical protein